MKKSNIVLGATLCVLILIGCEDMNTSPTDSVSEDIYWERERDARLAVNAAYGELDGTLMVKELDGVTDIGYRGTSGPGTLHDVSGGTIDPSNTAIGSTWDRYYRGVRRANDVITNIDNIEDGDPELLERYEAEARFLRAYFYTQLSSLWGSVPLIQEPLEINDHVGRTDKDDVVDFVIDELDDIIDSNALPISYDDSDVGRATHGAALALKARAALRNNRYDIARDAAQEVMDLGEYELYPDYEELFEYAGQNSEEVIFDRQYSIGGDTYNAFAYSAGSIGGSTIVEPIHSLFEKYDYDGAENPDDPYENIDPRWDYTVYYPGQPIGNSTYDSRPGSGTNDEVGKDEFTTEHGYSLKKWVDYENDSDNASNGSINMILIRYADVLLMYAEAKVELNEIDESVYDAINEVRQRPSVDMPPIETGQSQEELREIIRDERAVELAFEGLRLYDMNRWEIGEEKAGLVEGMWYQDNGEWTLYNRGFERRFRSDRDYLWPIPQAEMEINDEISQNPNY